MVFFRHSMRGLSLNILPNLQVFEGICMDNTPGNQVFKCTSTAIRGTNGLLKYSIILLRKNQPLAAVCFIVVKCFFWRAVYFTLKLDLMKSFHCLQDHVHSLKLLNSSSGSRIHKPWDASPWARCLEDGSEHWAAHLVQASWVQLPSWRRGVELSAETAGKLKLDDG